MKKLTEKQLETEMSLAAELFNKGQAPAALQRIDSVLRSNPDSATALFAKGSMLFALDRKPEALDAYNKVLAHQPNHPQALFWAAQLSLSLQRTNLAESLAKRLIRLQPKNDRAHFLLSIAQSMTGRWLDALGSIEEALTVQPSSLDYIVGKAQLLRKLHINRLAIEWYGKAIAIQPTPQLSRELAEVLIEENQVPEALALLEPLVEDLPDEARPNELLAKAYTETRRFDQAQPYWIAASKFSPNSRQIVTSRARSEIAAGRLDVAEALLREALAQTASSDLFGILALIVKVTEADQELIRNTEMALEKGAISPLEKQSLCYALGKSYHDLGNYEKAMTYYDEANRLRAALSPNNLKFDREDWTANIDFQIDFFTKERIASLADEGLENEKPLFVIGMIRSGTTLCEQILSCHSQIEEGGESAFWTDHHTEIANRFSQKYEPQQARRLGKEFLKVLDSRGSKSRYVIDKNPLNVLVACLLHCVYPNARMIHLKRHPVDTLLSIWMTPITTGLQFISTREDLVFAYKEYMRLAAHLEDVLPKDRFKTIAYEDLTSEPVPTVNGALQFLGLEPEEACFHPELNPRTVRTPSVFQVRQPINRNSQERWKLYEPWLGPFSELM